jgi:hypothetical protein
MSSHSRLEREGASAYKEWIVDISHLRQQLLQKRFSLDSQVFHDVDELWAIQGR